MKKDIIVEKYDPADLDEEGITSWPVWEKEVSRFDWTYDDIETCYILEGQATVESENGKSVVFSSGDKVIFPKGLKCVWNITSPIKKYYKFG